MSSMALALAGLLAAQSSSAAVEPPVPSERYEETSARAIAHFLDNAYAPVREACVQVPPVDTDLDYRFACLSSNESDPGPTIPHLLDLHVEALAADEVNLAALSLSLAAWRQSATGDIRGAFETSERALTLAGHASPEVLNDVTLNTSALYVMHGDPEYVARGVELQQLTIQRFRDMKEARPGSAAGADFGIALSQYNAGVAHALHLDDYARALEWFRQVDPGNLELRRSTLVFSALSAAELGRNGQARQLLAQSLEAPVARGLDTEYLACYQQLLRMKLDGEGELQPCRDLGAQTQLEVSLDLYKRMAAMQAPEWRLLGLEGLHGLFVETLEPQLKHSAMHAASRAELSRLQVETRLQEQLLQKERALKQAEQARALDQRLLAGALVAILLLVLLVIGLRLRHNRKLAQHFLAMSIQDGLTGLHNRRYFEHNIEREMSQARRAQREGSPRTIAICLLDIDHFKRINDTHGHDVGDAVLVELARRLRAATRSSDILVRWGGEEFLLLTWVKRPDEVHTVLERGRRVVAERPFLVGGLSLDVTCTIGAMVHPQLDDDAADVEWQRLVQLADAALYMGKHEGRNGWVSIDGVQDAAVLDEDIGLGLAELEARGRVSLGRGTDR